MRMSQMMGNAPRWVSGVAYPLDALVWSPVNYHYYRRILAGAGVTDPSVDSANWRLMGPGGIKSMQRGAASIASGSYSVTVNHSAVSLEKSFIILNGGSIYAQATSRIILPYVKSRTATSFVVDGEAGVLGTPVFFAWQMPEYY